MMDRDYFYKMMGGDGSLDYEKYINTPALLKAQKPFQDLCNADELQFQIVHQVEELWMKLIAFSLLEIDDYIIAQNCNRVITLFDRVHILQRHLISQLALLETMSPLEYQEIRLQLGNGSGQESPGFKTLLKMPSFLWESFEKTYLKKKNQTVEDIYQHAYDHGDAYMIAERLVEFDELFQTFRFQHLQLIRRSIGAETKSLKGRPIENLEQGVKHQFFPALWTVRSKMTDDWGGSYGVKRDSISDGGGFH